MTDAGKTTLAVALKRALKLQGLPVVHFDGEELRALMDNYDFTEAGRRSNITTVQALATKLHAEGVVVVTSFVSPYRQLRKILEAGAQPVEVR